MCALDHVFKIPPDPGHATDGKCISNDRIYADLEGREETTSSTMNEVQLQTFTCSYVRNQESSFEAQIVLIKGDEMCEQDPSPIAHQKIHLHKLQARCLTLCLMAEEVAKNSPNPGAVESLPAGVFHRRAGKEVMESSEEGEKKVLVIDMSRAREAQCPQFLAVGLYLSVLQVNPKQLFDHLKKVWKMRGDLEVNPLESDAGKKFVLVFSVEGD